MIITGTSTFKGQKGRKLLLDKTLNVLECQIFVTPIREPHEIKPRKVGSVFIYKTSPAEIIVYNSGLNRKKFEYTIYKEGDK